MYLEYDWTFSVYRVRFGDRFIAWRGQRSFKSLADAKAAIESAGCALGPKTDSRSWRIDPQEA